MVRDHLSWNHNREYLSRRIWKIIIRVTRLQIGSPKPIMDTFHLGHQTQVSVILDPENWESSMQHVLECWIILLDVTPCLQICRQTIRVVLQETGLQTHQCFLFLLVILLMNNQEFLILIYHLHRHRILRRDWIPSWIISHFGESSKRDLYKTIIDTYMI